MDIIGVSSAFNSINQYAGVLLKSYEATNYAITYSCSGKIDKFTLNIYTKEKAGHILIKQCVYKINPNLNVSFEGEHDNYVVENYQLLGMHLKDLTREIKEFLRDENANN